MELKKDNYNEVRGFLSPNISWRIRKGSCIRYRVCELIISFLLTILMMYVMGRAFGETFLKLQTVIIFIGLYSANALINFTLSRFPYFRAD